MAAPYQTFCDLPQLGGDYFDPVHRPSGHPSLTLRCPIVPVETLNDISDRTHNLALADEEIRARPLNTGCNGAVSCSCDACVAVRREFLAALQSLMPATAPPPPVDSPPRPPSTLPPRMHISDKRTNMVRIPASVPEGSQLVTNAPFAEEVPENFSFDNAPSSSSFRATDLPTISLPLPLEDEGSIAGSEAPSEVVTHVSSRGHLSIADSAPDAEWLFAAGKPKRKEEWLYDATDVPQPNRLEVDPRLTANAVCFDMHSNASEASWVLPHKSGIF